MHTYVIHVRMCLAHTRLPRVERGNPPRLTSLRSQRRVESRQRDDGHDADQEPSPLHPLQRRHLSLPARAPRPLGSHSTPPAPRNAALLSAPLPLRVSPPSSFTRGVSQRSRDGGRELMTPVSAGATLRARGLCASRLQGEWLSLQTALVYLLQLR